MTTLATHYALAALVHLARAGPRVCSGPAIADAEAIPRKYLQHLMTDLRRAGLVTSIDGRRGGYRLARLPATISIRDVVCAMQDVRREPRFEPLPTGTAHERASAVIARAFARFYDDLAMTSLDDLATPAAGSPLSGRSDPARDAVRLTG